MWSASHNMAVLVIEEAKGVGVGLQEGGVH